jgi:NAD(P)-dependent dehydrogenase (short-subunit alcohol dehydrogenase family)
METKMYKGFDLSGKVAVLTGSTAGMGLAIAKGLAQCGAKIVVSSNIQQDTDEGAHKLVAEGYEAKGVKFDVTNNDDIERFGREAHGAYGRADILFCLAAGPAPIGPIAELDPNVLNAMLISTVGNNLALMRQFLPGMAQRKYGSIVVMSSAGSMRANPVLGGYGAAKAALNGVIRSIAVEWGASNIRANALAPSVVRTGFSKDLWSDPDREKALLAKIPANRIADAEDMVGVAILLASPAGSYISGQVLLVDGARSVA